MGIAKITAFITVRAKSPGNGTIATLKVLSVPEEDIDAIVQSDVEHYGAENVSVKRGESLRADIEANRKTYEEVDKILKEMGL